MNNNSIIKVGVCEGRHEMPVRDFLFPQELDPTKVEEMEMQAWDKLKSMADEQGIQETWIIDSDPRSTASPARGGRPYKLRYAAEVDIYATGLTAAVLAAVNIACLLFDEVKVMHYNRDTGEYYPQRIQ